MTFVWVEIGVVSYSAVFISVRFNVHIPVMFLSMSSSSGGQSRNIYSLVRSIYMDLLVHSTQEYVTK